MTKQEVIREGIARIAHTNGRIWPKIYKTEDPHNCKWEELSEYHQEIYKGGADDILHYLHSQGVVIKVERGMPCVEEDNPFIRLDEQAKIHDAGFTAWEPLIKEEE